MTFADGLIANSPPVAEIGRNTMNSFAKARIERAKRTLVGRFVCRLLGEQTGAVLMEYVVLGAMVAAAAVALVLLFGKGIRERLMEMIDALRGKPKVEQTITDDDIAGANEGGKNIAGGEGMAE